MEIIELNNNTFLVKDVVIKIIDQTSENNKPSNYKIQCSSLHFENLHQTKVLIHVSNLNFKPISLNQLFYQELGGITKYNDYIYIIADLIYNEVNSYKKSVRNDRNYNNSINNEKHLQYIIIKNKGKHILDIVDIKDGNTLPLIEDYLNETSIKNKMNNNILEQLKEICNDIENLKKCSFNDLNNNIEQIKNNLSKTLHSLSS